MSVFAHKGIAIIDEVVSHSEILLVLCILFSSVLWHPGINFLYSKHRMKLE